MLIIHCNNSFRPEREYIYDCVFHDFWQIDYKIKYEKRNDVELEYNGVSLYIADTFLQMDERSWLRQESLPLQPLVVLNVPLMYEECVTDTKLPVIYGDSADALFLDDEKKCSVDIFGSALFMLTRYEEIVKKERDELDRFPARASLACQEGFEERPIINEYLEIIWKWMTKYFSGIERRKRVYTIMPTHDVDVPFWGMYVDNWHKFRLLCGDVLKRREWSTIKKHICYIYDGLRKKYESDPFNTFDMVMDTSEKNGVKSNFYFMTAQGKSNMDGNYDLSEPKIKRLIKNIVERGHNIGIHFSFNSYDNQLYVNEESDKIRDFISKKNIPQESFGGRYHWLRWKTPDSWKYNEMAGIDYDSTMGFVECLGFRCGICYDYPVYNVMEHKKYKLREYPLIVMDGSGLADYGLKLSKEEMLAKCNELKKKVKKFNGVFVILWHNSFFTEDGYAELYKEIVSR